MEYKAFNEDFPGGPVVKNLPAHMKDTRGQPLVKELRSHMPQVNKAREPQLLSLHSRAQTPTLLSPRAATTEAHELQIHKRNHHKEKLVHRNLKVGPAHPNWRRPTGSNKESMHHNEDPAVKNKQLINLNKYFNDPAYVPLYIRDCSIL